MTAGSLRAIAHLRNRLDEASYEILDALPVAIYITDSEGRLTYFNAAAAKLSGRTPQLGVDQWCVTWKIFLADGTPCLTTNAPWQSPSKAVKSLKELNAWRNGRTGAASGLHPIRPSCAIRTVRSPGESTCWWISRTGNSLKE